MSEVDFTLNAEKREDKGKGASRRLRRTGRVPAIMYGAGKDPVAISLDQNALIHDLENEAIYSHILTVNLDGSKEKAILRDLHRHPSKPTILHLDLQRVSEDEEIRVNVPLHFVGEEAAHGVKIEGGEVSHLMTEIEVSCLPKDLPEFIEVDISGMNLNDILHLSDIKLPSGVEIVELSYGEEHDQAIVNIHPKRKIEEPEEGSEQPEAETKPADKPADSEGDSESD